MQLIRALGYPLVPREYDDWRAELKRMATADHPHRDAFGRLWMVLNSANNFLAKRPRYETPNLLEGLAGTGIVCPAIDQRLIAAYIEYFQRIGYVSKPAASEGVA
jgi:hypothetical protein